MTGDEGQIRSIVVIGATSAIAEACMREWCAQPTRFVLVGRRQDALERIAADLRVRNPAGETAIVRGDFTGVEHIGRTIDRALADQPADIALVAFGSLADQRALASDPYAFVEALEINGVWPALFAQLLFEHMRVRDRGRLILLGSVAGDRGRRSNYTYGSAKAMLATVAGGLQHAAAGTGVQVTLVKPGPTDTPMTRGAGITKRLATPEAVAHAIVTGADAGRPVVYAPPIWRAIMAVIRSLPAAIHNRLDI